MTSITIGGLFGVLAFEQSRILHLCSVLSPSLNILVVSLRTTNFVASKQVTYPNAFAPVYLRLVRPKAP